MSFNISHGQGELLAQLAPPNGTTNVLFSIAADGLRTEITLITCAIDPGGTLFTPGQIDIDIFHDDDGTTYDQTTRIISETRLVRLQDSIIFQAQHPGSGIHVRPGGSIGLMVSDADDVNVSLYGITETRAERVVGR